jgi:hypothetical protein
LNPKRDFMVSSVCFQMGQLVPLYAPAMFCLGLGIMCGAIGYVGANSFVRRIYRNIKCD